MDNNDLWKHVWRTMSPNYENITNYLWWIIVNLKWKSTYSPKVFSQPPPFRMPTRTTIKLQKLIIVMIVIIIIINYADPDQHWAAEIKVIILINHFLSLPKQPACDKNRTFDPIINWYHHHKYNILYKRNCMRKVKNNCWRQTTIHRKDY